MICPKCGGDKVYPSRLKNDNEFFIALITSFDPYRCMGCQHRWWKFRWRPRKREGGIPLPDLKGGFHRFRRDLKMWWPQNRGRIIPIMFKLFMLTALAVGIAALIAYSTGRMKGTSEYAKPTSAVKK